MQLHKGADTLEQKAVQFGLKSLCKSKSDVHIRLRIDNALTYINNMGGTKSRICVAGKC